MPALAGSSKEAHPPVLMESDTGLMLYALQFECTISNPMDLSEFPFDSGQSLIVTRVSKKLRSQSCVFRCCRHPLHAGRQAPCMYG
jgi:hypothetical protein